MQHDERPDKQHKSRKTMIEQQKEGKIDRT